MNIGMNLFWAAAICVSLVLLGCKQESAMPALATAAAVAPAGPTSDKTVIEDSVGLPLPGLKLSFPYQIQSDSTFNSIQTGQLRRAVVVEFHEEDLRTVFDEAADALKGMGYSTRAAPLDKGDVITQSFYGRGGAYLEAREDLGPRPKDPASAGVVALSWPIKSLSEPVPLVQ